VSHSWTLRVLALCIALGVSRFILAARLQQYAARMFARPQQNWALKSVRCDAVPLGGVFVDVSKDPSAFILPVTETQTETFCTGNQTVYGSSCISKGQGGLANQNLVEEKIGRILNFGTAYGHWVHSVVFCLFLCRLKAKTVKYSKLERWFLFKLCVCVRACWWVGEIKPVLRSVNERDVCVPEFVFLLICNEYPGEAKYSVD